MAVTAGNTELSLTTSNYSVIRAVVIVAEHLFEGESCVRLVFTYKESLQISSVLAKHFEYGPWAAFQTVAAIIVMWTGSTYIS